MYGVSPSPSSTGFHGGGLTSGWAKDIVPASCGSGGDYGKGSPRSSLAHNLAHAPDERMTMRERINQALKTAQKAQDKTTVSVLRMVNAGIKDRDIAVRPEGRDRITDAEIIDLLAKMIRQRRESVQMYKDGGRADLVAQEEAEVVIIEGFLPAQLGEAETQAACRAVVDELGAKTIKDMGRVMAALKERHSGQMDFGKVGPIVKELLK
jgi:uncharacterized protein